MRLTLPHYFEFGEDFAAAGRDLRAPERWDALRTQTNGAFAIPQTRTELEAQADARRELEARAAAIVAQGSKNSLASYGVGTGLLELWLIRLRPDLSLKVTEYAPETVARLRELLPETEVVAHDLRRDPPLEVDLHLFHRIDTELPNHDWRKVFRRFATERIVLAASEVIDARRARKIIRGLIENRGRTRAGWLRNRDAFESLWRKTHRAEPVKFHDLDGWLLAPKTIGGERDPVVDEMNP